MRDDKRQTVKIELLSQWKLEAESRNITRLAIFSRAGYYTMGEQLDYPSVSHISSVAQVLLSTFIQN